MKVKFYVDLDRSWPVKPGQALFATTQPGLKPMSCERFRITIDLPDEYFSPDSQTDADADVIERTVQVGFSEHRK